MAGESNVYEGSGGYNYASNRGPGAINGAYVSGAGTGASSSLGEAGKPRSEPTVAPSTKQPPGSPSEYSAKGRRVKLRPMVLMNSPS